MNLWASKSWRCTCPHCLCFTYRKVLRRFNHHPRETRFHGRKRCYKHPRRLGCSFISVRKPERQNVPSISRRLFVLNVRPEIDELHVHWGWVIDDFQASLLETSWANFHRLLMLYWYLFNSIHLIYFHIRLGCGLPEASIFLSQAIWNCWFLFWHIGFQFQIKTGS